MGLDPVTNFGKVEVSIGYDASATSIDLIAGDGAQLPSTFSYNLVWYNASDYFDPSDDRTNREIVRVTARSADTLTVTRAQEGTSATTKNTTDKVYRMILSPTKKTIDDISIHIDDTADPHSITWAQVNKTTSDIADITTKAHTSLSAIGTNTHTQIDTHIADSTIHFIEANINHGFISGLGNSADHAWATLINGTRAFTGNQSFGDFNITNVGNIALDSISSAAETSITVNLGTDVGDNFIIGNDLFVFEGNTGFQGIGTNAPENMLDVVRGTSGTMAKGFFESASFESDGDHKVGIYTSTSNPALGADLIFGQTNLQANSLFPGMSIQYIYSSTPEDNALRVNYTERAVDGSITNFAAEVFKVFADGRVVLLPILSGATASPKLGINEGNPDAMLEIVTSSTTEEGIKIKGSPNQTGDLVTATDSSDNIGFKVEAVFDVVIGSGAAGKDYTLTFHGENNDVVLTAKEDEKRLDIAAGLKTDEGRIVNTTRFTSGPQTLDSTHHIVYLDTDGGAFTANLPAGVEGTNYELINVGTSGNDATIDPNGTEQLFASGAGVSFALHDAEVINIHFNSTEGWF